jgi:hypothetical protein
VTSFDHRPDHRLYSTLKSQHKYKSCSWWWLVRCPVTGLLVTVLEVVTVLYRNIRFRTSQIAPAVRVAALPVRARAPRRPALPLRVRRCVPAAHARCGTRSVHPVAPSHGSRAHTRAV